MGFGIWNASASEKMNGIHDMGGLHGFGAVEVEADEPVFHEVWEGRVFAIAQSLGGNIDGGRHSLERLDPVAYLKNGYYGRWLAALERGLQAAGVIDATEIDERIAKPRRRKARRAKKPAGAPPVSRTYVREVETRPVFAAGDAVVVRNHQPEGHTRLPAYARLHRGVVSKVHPAMVFPDDNARGRGENPQYLYTVRFTTRELWGDGDPRAFLYLDLFESYLQATDRQPGEGDS
jgi:nitrile hydratase